MKVCFTLFMIVLTIASQSQGEEIKLKSLDEKKEDQSNENGRERDGKVVKVVGFYSQTTLLSLLTRTTSAIFTCLSTTGGANAVQCNGRRRRRALIKEFNGENADQGEGILDGSQNADDGLKAFMTPIIKKDERTGKRVTVWSTTYSTLEIFITNGIVGSTVTVSALCNAVGNSLIGQSCFVG